MIAGNYTEVTASCPQLTATAGTFFPEFGIEGMTNEMPATLLGGAEEAGGTGAQGGLGSREWFHLGRLAASEGEELLREGLGGGNA